MGLQRDESSSTHSSRADAIAALYDDHVDDLYRFIYRRCQDEQLSEDITQETFLSVVHGPLEPGAITRGWLYTVARNRLFDTLRRQNVYDKKLQLIMASVSTSEVVDLAERLRVESALRELPVDYRLVLTLHYVDGYTVPALADHLGRTVKSVEALVTRARRALRDELENDSLRGGRRG